MIFGREMTCFLPKVLELSLRRCSKKGFQDVSTHSTLSKMAFVGVCKRPYLAGYKCQASHRVKGHRIRRMALYTTFLKTAKRMTSTSFIEPEKLLIGQILVGQFAQTASFNANSVFYRGQSAASQNLFLLLFPPWLVYSSIRSKRKLAAIS